MEIRGVDSPFLSKNNPNLFLEILASVTLLISSFKEDRLVSGDIFIESTFDLDLIFDNNLSRIF